MAYHDLTVAYRRQLLGLRAVMLRDLRRLWPLFNPNDTSTWPDFLKPATTLVQTHHSAAAALGGAYYSALRASRLGLYVPANDVAVGSTPVLNDFTVRRTLLGGALAGTFNALRVGATEGAALDNGFVKSGMAAGRLVMNGGRDAVLAAVRGDARARGYVRVTDGAPCAFCASLAGEESSPDGFPAHDGCGCTAEPTWA